MHIYTYNVNTPSKALTSNNVTNVPLLLDNDSQQSFALCTGGCSTEMTWAYIQSPIDTNIERGIDRASKPSMTTCSLIVDDGTLSLM